MRSELDRRYPPYPVNHYQVRSITHESTRVIVMDPRGGIEGHVANRSPGEGRAQHECLGVC